MQLSHVEQLQQTLHEVKTTIPGVEAAAIVSAEGLTIASVLPPDFDEERLVAMTAALLDVGQRTAAELALGQLEQVYIRGANGYVVMIPAGMDAVITVVLGKDAKLGLVFLNLRRFADQIARALVGI